jgi:hypothetical protein
MAAVLTGQEIHVKNKTCHIMAAVLTDDWARNSCEE